MQDSGLRSKSELEGVGIVAVSDARAVAVDIYHCFRIEIGNLMSQRAW
jgi:hypothetical protein